MHMLWRTLTHILIHSRRKPRLGQSDVARTTFRVAPTDLDLNRHMNNGKYLSIMDVARFDLTVRSGVLAQSRSRGWYPVVVAETISFRKSLSPWQKFVIETRLIGFDERGIYLEQRFVAPDGTGVEEVYARAVVCARFLKKSGGSVSVAEFAEVMGASSAPIPEWIQRWVADTRLPSTRTPAPSVWD